MQKRLVLTLLVAVGCACPIFAARAKYEIAAGTYLPAGATAAEQCPANSYCPGIADATYNESAAQGATSCPDGYPNSVAGASRDTQCYTACTVDMVEHAMAVDGNDYYDTGVDTCGATACENGYHVEGMIKVVEQTPLIDVDYTVAGKGYSFYGYISAVGGKINADTYGLTENNTWATEFNYGVVYGRASCQATPHDPGLEYMTTIMDAVNKGETVPDRDTVRSDLTPIVGATKANYMADIVAGIADGSLYIDEFREAKHVVFGLSKDALFSTTDTGQYCYCQMTGFREAGSTETLGVDSASAPWVFILEAGSGNTCARNCANYCADNLRVDDTGDRVFRGAVYGAFGATVPGSCAANEITINWTDATADDIAANNAGMCTYNGEIRTPVRAATKPGKTFVGWKFSK